MPGWKPFPPLWQVYLESPWSNLEVLSLQGGLHGFLTSCMMANAALSFSRKVISEVPAPQWWPWGLFILNPLLQIPSFKASFQVCLHNLNFKSISICIAWLLVFYVVRYLCASLCGLTTVLSYGRAGIIAFFSSALLTPELTSMLGT